MSARANIAAPTLREMMEFIVPACSVGQQLQKLSELTGVDPRVLRDARGHRPVSARAEAAIRTAYNAACDYAELKAFEWELLNAAYECNIKDLARASEAQASPGNVPGEARTAIWPEDEK